MIPIKLEMENFRSYEHSVVNFDFTSALIVGENDNDPRKSNGVGKSSIFEAICWVLFGYLEKRQADSVVKWGEATCKVTLDFMQDNHKYRVIRTRIARYSRMITQFYKLPENLADFDPEDKRYQLHGDGNKSTEKTICNVLKSNYDVFVNSSYFRQNSFFEFAQGTDASRQELLGSLLNLDRWTVYRKQAKDQFDIHNAKIKELRRDLEKVAQADERLAETIEQLKETGLQIDDITQTNSILEEEIKSLESKLAKKGKQKDDLYKYNELEKKHEELTNQISEIADKAEELERAYNENEVRIIKDEKARDALNAELESIKEEIASKQVDDLKSRIIAMENAILEGKAKRKALTQEIENFNNDACMLCGNTWDDKAAKLAAVEERKIQLDELLLKLDRATSKLDSAKEGLDARRKLEIDLEKNESRVQNLVGNIEQKQVRNSLIYKEQEGLAAKLPGLEDERVAIKTLLEGMIDVEKLKEPETLHSKLEQKKGELKRNADAVSELTFEKGRLTEAEKSLSEQAKEFKRLSKELVVQTKSATVYSQLTKAFSREGVPAIIIDNVIEDLTRRTNEWLVDICTKPTQIAFVTQKKTNKGDWKESMDIEVTTPACTCGFSDLSGGEQFRVAFALRLALSSLQARRLGGETQILLLDEVSTSLDPYGIDIFVSIIRRLERSMKVLVITHDNNLKDEFDRIITVKSDGNGNSFVEM